MEDMCGGNRFEVVANARKAISVLDTSLFRCWQMGWLDKCDLKPKYQKGERIFWKHGHLVYSMVIEDYCTDIHDTEFMYVAVKPKCKYAMYWVRESHIIEKPTMRDILLAKLSFGIECVLGLLKYKRK